MGCLKRTWWVWVVQQLAWGRFSWLALEASVIACCRHTWETRKQTFWATCEAFLSSLLSVVWSSAIRVISLLQLTSLMLPWPAGVSRLCAPWSPPVPQIWPPNGSQPDPPLFLRIHSLIICLPSSTVYHYSPSLLLPSVMATPLTVPSLHSRANSFFHLGGLLKTLQG